MRVLQDLGHLDPLMYIGSYKAICQIHANVSANSAYCGLAAQLHSDTAQILSLNPQSCGFATHAHSWRLHLSWRWFKAIELQTCKNMGFRFNFSNSLARWHGPEPTSYRVLMSIWIFLKNSNPLLWTDVQSARGSVEQIQEFGKLDRATRRA